MASILSLPVELIQSFDDITRLRLSLVCKYLHSLVPEYKEHLMYPDYIAALERRDFMCLYRHKNTPSLYHGEELNIPEHHPLVEYLSYSMKVQTKYIPDCKDMIYPYESNPAIIMGITSFGIREILNIHSEDIASRSVALSMVIHAIKDKHPQALELMTVEDEGGNHLLITNSTVYHAIKNGMWRDSVCAKNVFVSKMLYAYGYTNAQDAMEHHNSYDIATASLDYPDLVLEYVRSLEEDYVVNHRLFASILSNAASLHSPLIAKYISQLSEPDNSTLETDITMCYPTKEIADVLAYLGGDFLNILCKMYGRSIYVDEHILKNHGDKIIDRLDKLRHGRCLDGLISGLKQMDSAYAIRLITKYSCYTVLLDKIFSLIPPTSLNPGGLSFGDRYQLAGYFIQKNNLAAAKHFI